MVHTPWQAASLVAIAAVGTGCAVTSADFRLASVKSDEAAIAGRLTVMYNGRIYTDNCRAQFGEQAIKLSSDGIVLFKVHKGWTALQRLECDDTSKQHIRIKGAHFFARGEGTVTDFGDVAITWAAAGGFKVSSLFGAIGAMYDMSTDDGVASVAVQAPVAATRDAFHRQTGVEGSWHVSQMSQPVHAPDAPPPAVDADAPATGPRGFFCVGGGRIELCERDQASCERDLRMLREPAAACAAHDTAWCYARDGRLRCLASQQACHALLPQELTDRDNCGEQY